MEGKNYESAYAIAVDGQGNNYNGSFYGTADFDPSYDTYNLVSYGGSEIFVSKLDASGNFL